MARSSLQSPAGLRAPFCYHPYSKSTDELNPSRQRINYKLEIHQLAPYQGKEGTEGDTKQKDANPLSHMHFPAVTLVAFQKKRQVLNKKWCTHSTQSYHYISAELEDCEGSREGYTSLHTQQREERK